MPVPAGFAPHFRQSPLTEPWEPLFSRRLPDRIVIGLEVRSPHTNSRGLLHGGLISAIADNAMGLSCVAAQMTAGETEPRGMVTVGLQVDFLGQARIGQWLQFDPEVVQSGRTLAFTSCRVTADGVLIARASATFRTVTKALSGTMGDATGGTPRHA